MSEDQNNIASILPKLQEREVFNQNMNMRSEMMRILSRVIPELRAVGASDRDIAAVLRHAAGVLDHAD